MANLKTLLERAGGDRLIIIDYGGASDHTGILASHTVEVPAGTLNRQTQTLALARGLHDEPVDGAYATHTAYDGRVQLTEFADWHTAVSQFLNVLERHALDESTARNLLNSADYDFTPYWDDIDSLDADDRRDKVLHQLHSRADRDEMYDQYLQDGSFRDTGAFSDEQHSLVDQLRTNSDESPYVCYQTAMTALEPDFLDDDRVRYVEGVALQKYPGHITKHAWVELDGQVVELSWPWHSPSPADGAVYYGIPLDPRDAHDKMQERGRYCGVTIPDETYDALSP